MDITPKFEPRDYVVYPLHAAKRSGGFVEFEWGRENTYIYELPNLLGQVHVDVMIRGTSYDDAQIVEIESNLETIVITAMAPLHSMGTKVEITPVYSMFDSQGRFLCDE